MRMSKKAMLDFRSNIELGFDTRDDDGRWNQRLWDAWKERTLRLVQSVDSVCAASHDSTEIWWFRDGTAVEVDNPKQAAFCGHVSIIY